MSEAKTGYISDLSHFLYRLHNNPAFCICSSKPEGSWLLRQRAKTMSTPTSNHRPR